MHETAKLAAITIRIGNEVKSLNVLDELFASQAFLAIYEHPEPYFPAALALMSGKEMNPHQKTIMGLAMQRLPLDRFLEFVGATADSVDRNATDFRVLNTTAFPPLNWGSQSLIMHYDDPRVRALLQRLAAMKGFSADRKSYIHDEILTGQAKLKYLDYLDMIGRRPR